MKLRLIFVLLRVSLACKPAAESQTVDARQPRQERAPIPPTVAVARRTPIVNVAHDVGAAVVNIQTESTIRRREVDPFDPFGIFGGRDRSFTSQSLGSGFVWSSEGIIVTNNHVVEGASSITVNFSDGTQLPARLIGVDPDSDVAVLRGAAENLLAAPVRTPAGLLVGETGVGVANPLRPCCTVTTRVVS